MVFVRDCFVHLSYCEKNEAINNIKKSSPFKDELKTAIINCKTDIEKIETIYLFIKNRVN